MKDDIKAALEILQKGGIILYPTDTVWGLGCDACNEEAVSKICAVANLSKSEGMTILMENAALLERYVEELPEIAYDLFELSEKPLTIIFDGARGLAKNLLAFDGSIGVRITTEVFSKELIRRTKRPVVFTPANLNGKPAPACFDEIDREIIDSVDYVVNYRQDEITKTELSSVIKLGRRGEIKVVRD